MPAAATLCRDCGARDTPADTKRCHRCASPRLVRHRELDELTIAHLDCDAFYAAVEKRDDPRLRDRPVIIGGGRRGVVSTACYTARLYGIHSAMPMFQALERCPHAVLLKPDMAKYKAVGAEVRALMRSITDKVQPVSIDEAYLDLTEAAVAAGAPAAVLANRLTLTIERTLGITVSIGLSYNKFMAKLASDLDKPRGFAVIGRAEARARLRPMPVSKIWGVGPALSAKLKRDGIATIGQLQAPDEAALVARYGKSVGAMLFRFSRGEDQRAVKPRGGAKSISAETTLETDAADFETLDGLLIGLCERVAASLARNGLAGSGVTLKLKRSDFRTRTRSLSLSNPTRSAAVLHRHGAELLRQELTGESFRLIGIGAHRLTPAAAADPPQILAGLDDAAETARPQQPGSGRYSR